MDTLFNLDSETITTYVIPWAINFVVAIIIFVIGRWLAKKVTNAVKHIMEKANIDSLLSDFLGNIIYAALIIVILIAALEQLGVDTTSVLAVFAAAGLAVGLALKDSLSNFAAGVMLILFKPFKIGDVIEAAGITGTVESIRIFNSMLRTGDNREITVPNSQIYGGTITNVTARDTRRIDLVIGIGYEDDIGRAKSILSEILTSNQLVLSDPSPTVMMLELGESSIDIAVRPWVKTTDYWAVRAELLEEVKQKFDNNSISFPYPQRDLHVYNASGV